MVASKVVPIVRASGAGERLWFYGGGLPIWEATSAETGDAFLLFEDVMSRGKTTPLHTHAQVDETLYVLEGEILLQVDGEDQRLGSGAVAMAPRGVPHAFLVTSEMARILFLETPGTSEAFYRGASEPATPELEAAAPLAFPRAPPSATPHRAPHLPAPPPLHI